MTQPKMSIRSMFQGIQPAGKFLLLMGLFLFCLGLASMVQMLILFSFSEVKSLNDVIAINDFSNPNIINGMKIAQAASAILVFILPAFLFAYLAASALTEWEMNDKQTAPALPLQKWNILSYLKINNGFNIISGILTIMLVFAVMPLVNWTGELNSRLSLPDFMSGIENWMKSSEESLKQLTDAFLQMDTIGDLLINIVIIALLAAIGEEFFFRGAMQNVFLEWTKNSHAAVWITAILFSALHAQFYGFLPRMLLGVVLGYLYVWSGSLWLPILFHFLNNGLAVFFFYLIGKNMVSPEVETIGSGEGMWMYMLASTAISIYIMISVNKQRKVEVTE